MTFLTPPCPPRSPHIPSHVTGPGGTLPRVSVLPDLPRQPGVSESVDELRRPRPVLRVQFQLDAVPAPGPVPGRLRRFQRQRLRRRRVTLVRVPQQRFRRRLQGVEPRPVAEGALDLPRPVVARVPTRRPMPRPCLQPPRRPPRPLSRPQPRGRPQRPPHPGPHLRRRHRLRRRRRLRRRPRLFSMALTRPRPVSTPPQVPRPARLHPAATPPPPGVPGTDPQPRPRARPPTRPRRAANRNRERQRRRRRRRRRSPSSRSRMARADPPAWAREEETAGRGGLVGRPDRRADRLSRTPPADRRRGRGRGLSLARRSRVPLPAQWPRAGRGTGRFRCGRALQAHVTHQAPFLDPRYPARREPSPQSVDRPPSAVPTHPSRLPLALPPCGAPLPQPVPMTTKTGKKVGRGKDSRYGGGLRSRDKGG